MSKLSNKSFEDIKSQMQARLSEHRFQHSLGVLDAALEIFETLKDKLDLEDKKQIISEEEFVEKLKLAAILHDSCKELSNEEQIKSAELYGLNIYAEDKDSPNLLHGRVAAKWIEEEYGILDPYISKAVAEHTLGDENMLLSSKIIFLADMIEANRASYPKLEELREMIKVGDDINKLLLFAMDTKISYVIKKQQQLHPVAIKARNFLLSA